VEKYKEIDSKGGPTGFRKKQVNNEKVQPTDRKQQSLDGKSCRGGVTAISGEPNAGRQKRKKKRKTRRH